uniref:NR LBD domain-containing protein n=1 Tax=Caenorhabditis tropicalis TaxID=1561998 RepID=A0A1I7SYC5_9PELO
MFNMSATCIWKQLWDLTEHSKVPHCKSCRFNKCLETGMFIKPSALLKMSCRTEDTTMETIIGQLLYLDSRRSTILMNKFSFENPGLEEIVKRKKLNIVTQDSTFQMSAEDWRFFGMFTTVEFLLNLDFMEELDLNDKMILLKSFSAKATLLFSALRTMKEKSDRLMTPGGQEIVPDVLAVLFNVSMGFLFQIRSRLINKLIQLNVTNEEFFLVTVILFCDPGTSIFYFLYVFEMKTVLLTAVTSLSEQALPTITSRRTSYTSALFKYCQLTHQQTAHNRFTELLSLCHVVNKNIEDIQSLTIIAKFHLKTTECKQLYEDII